MINLTWEDVEKLSLSIAEAVRESGYDFDCIVGVARSGWVPAVIVAHELGVREVGTLSIVRNVSDGVDSRKAAPRLVDISPLAQAGRKWLVIEDIVGSGETVRFIREHFGVDGRDIYVASLVFNAANGDRAQVSEMLEFYGREVMEWVRFPWERRIES
ncbi:phosphoribosyltransferase family protein [Pseudomonas sp. RIT-PI-AD]|uniref:phosphoribosyltransferase n=1 Tax=Pseudomonas sp. RIT-PI-AD TaxID=3035294 RepID=UPI0021DB236D|nr:phosphoribosyltransferase family protein [Pseudomonas sp. RIT-PI-AD]